MTHGIAAVRCSANVIPGAYIDGFALGYSREPLAAHLQNCQPAKRPPPGPSRPGQVSFCPIDTTDD